MITKILRRILPALMVLALVVVPGIPGLADSNGANGGRDNQETSGKAGDQPAFAAFDRVQESVDENGNKVVDYLKGDAIIRREVYVDGVIEVYIASADGTTLERSGTIRPDAPTPYDGAVQKYQDEQGRTIVDTYESGALVQREVYDPATGEHVVTVYQDGKPVDSKSWKDEPQPTPFYDRTDSYPSEDGTAKIVDCFKDDAVVRREIYWPDRMEVYVRTPEGQLVLDESQSQVYPSPEPQPWNEEKKYVDDKGNTVLDFLKDGIVIRREVYDPSGNVSIYELDREGNLVLTAQSGAATDGQTGSGSAEGGTPADGGVLK